MMFTISGRVKKRISIIIIFVLAVVCCADFEVSFDSLSSGGDIKGCSSFSVSYSIIACAASAVSKSNVEADDQGQNIGRTDSSTDIFTRTIRKLLVVTGGLTPAGSQAHFKCYYLSLCVAGIAYLSSLTHIRFFHLKDGSK